MITPSEQFHIINNKCIILCLQTDEQSDGYKQTQGDSNTQ